MKELNLHEEILKSLKLISYDRSLTLSEQKIGSYAPTDSGTNPKPLVNGPKKRKESTPSKPLGQGWLGDVKQSPIVDHQKIENELKKLYDQNFYNQNRIYLPKINDTKEAINTILGKKYLKYNNVVDNETINTIKNIQKKYGLNVTGKIDDKTSKLISKKYEKIRKEWRQKQQGLKHDFEQEDIKQKNISKYNCKTRLQKKSSDPSENTAKKVFLELEDEIGHHWYDVSTWGTSRKDILNALKLIKNKETYNKVLEYVDLCYPESAGMTLIEFIQSEEFSPGQVGLELRAKSGSGMYGPGGSAPEMASWYLNDMHLKSYQEILQKFNKNEKYYQENPFLEKNFIKQYWQMEMPPYARELFHNATMLASIALTVFSGGATAPLLVSFGIDLADAAAFWAEGDPYMAGLCTIFALIPMGGITKNQFKKGVQWYKQLKALTPTARKRAISESPFNEMFQKITRSRNLIVAYKRLFKLKISKIIREIKDVSVFTRFLVGLFKIGFITIKFLTKLGLMVGGVFISWHLIAQKLGIIPKKQVTKNEQIKLDNKTKDFVIEYLTDPMNVNEIFSIKRNSSAFRLAVLLIQYCLRAGGYDVTNQERVEMTPEWEKKTPQGQVNFNYDPKYDYLYTSNGKNELNKKRQDWIRSKNTSLTKNSTKVKLNFKWGYFDENTDKMIKSFQKDHNLTPNGLVGKPTITAILSDLENGKMDTIKNFSGHKLTNKEEEYLYSKDIEKQQIESQKKLDNIKITKLQEEYDKQKNELIKTFESRLDNQEYIYQISAEEWDKKMKKLEGLEESVIKQ